MDFDSFVEGPLLWIVLLAFSAGIAARFAFFIFKIVKTSSGKKGSWVYGLSMFGRFLLPFHRAIAKRPLYAVLRYIFHICLFVVPIWLSGHILLWSESRFEWEWKSLPDAWADWMSLILLCIALYFVIRRIALSRASSDTSTTDFLLIIFAGLPFLTGYFLTHSTLEAIPLLAENIRVIHVLSAEAMILMAVFLFCRTRLNPRRCTGCASCELSCPTETLESKDQGASRVFNYSHYQCICCGACVNTCPEDAAELRHEVSLKRFFQVVPKQEIRSVEMKACQKCGALFVPEPLFDKISQTFKDEYLLLCPVCRRQTSAASIAGFHPPLEKKTGLLTRP